MRNLLIFTFGLIYANKCQKPETNENYIQCEEYFSGVYNSCVLNCKSEDFVCVSDCARVYRGSLTRIDKNRSPYY